MAVIRITTKKPAYPYPDGAPIWYIEGFGASTATKPSDGIAQGSWIFETDTKQVKFFDEESKTWG